MHALYSTSKSLLIGRMQVIPSSYRQPAWTHLSDIFIDSDTLQKLVKFTNRTLGYRHIREQLSMRRIASDFFLQAKRGKRLFHPLFREPARISELLSTQKT